MPGLRHRGNGLGIDEIVDRRRSALSSPSRRAASPSGLRKHRRGHHAHVVRNTRIDPRGTGTRQDFPPFVPRPKIVSRSGSSIPQAMRSRFSVDAGCSGCSA